MRVSWIIFAHCLSAMALVLNETANYYCFGMNNGFLYSAINNVTVEYILHLLLFVHISCTLLTSSFSKVRVYYFCLSKSMKGN